MIYVLVHGGATTGRFWDRLLPHLDRPALAVDLPGRNGKPANFATLTVDEESESIARDIEAASLTEPIVLVAHSSGGLVIPGVVARLPGRVAQVILNGALVPPEGGYGLDCMKPNHRAGLTAAVEQAHRDDTVITIPGPPKNPEAFRSAYGGEPLDDDTLAYVVDPVRCVQDSVHHHFQPVYWSRAAGIPLAYIINERDRPVPVALQEEMVARLPGKPAVARLQTGHVPAVTDPAKFAATLASLGICRS